MNWGSMTRWQIELLPWYAFLIAWSIGWLWVKPVKAAESFAARLFTGSVVAAAFVLLFSQNWPLGPLRYRMWPATATAEWTGIALTCAGAAIAIWARIILGANWSAKVTLKVDHELIRSGPYKYVRHPIYTGMLLAVIGTAVEIGEWRGLPAIALIMISVWVKSQREERFLTTEFGERYREYRQGTRALVPRL